MMVLDLRFGNRRGGLDAFVAAAGLGWTVAGLSRFLQVNLFPFINLNIHIRLVSESLSI